MHNIYYLGLSGEHRCPLGYLFCFFLLLFFFYGIIQFEQHVPFRVFLSVTSDSKVQFPRVGLEVKIYDTPAGGIHASQGTFST